MSLTDFKIIKATDLPEELEPLPTYIKTSDLAKMFKGLQVGEILRAPYKQRAAVTRLANSMKKQANWEVLIRKGKGEDIIYAERRADTKPFKKP